MANEIRKADFFREIGYAPHSAGQWSYHNSMARFRTAVCGRRYGKSTMAGKDLEPKLFQPKKRFWIVGPTYDLGEKEFRVIWDDLIIGKQMGRDKRIKKAYNKRSGDMYIEFPWQTRLEVRSADHPENLVGEALDWAIMSEAAKHKKETWERFIRPALADKRGGADFPTTPEGFNWLYDLWLTGQDKNIPEYESWKLPSWENRSIYPGGRNDPEILLLEKTTLIEYFLQEIAADFAAFVGKIFPEWQDTSHIKTHVFRPDWPNYIAFDWGYTNPLAAVEFQVSPQDEIFVWREHYKAYTILEEHVQMLKARDQPAGYRLDMGFGDAADPEAAEYISSHLVACIADPDAKKNWRQGIDLIRQFMKPIQVGLLDEYGTPMERPRYFVDPSCTAHIKEINNYKSKDSSSGTNVPEMGKKIEDHTIDAIRYALVSLFELGAKHHLSEVYNSQSFEQVPDTGTFVSAGSGMEF